MCKSQEKNGPIGHGWVDFYKKYDKIDRMGRFERARMSERYDEGWMEGCHCVVVILLARMSEGADIMASPRKRGGRNLAPLRRTGSSIRHCVGLWG